MKQETIVHIIADQISFFHQLLAQGILASTIAGTSIYHFLTIDIGIAPEYIDHRIQTIFLDGKAVDDVKNTFLKQGSILALSAAMPGLVGATFRKSGFYSSFRKNISYEQQSTVSNKQVIDFTLKLFNTIAKELGPGIFKTGIRVNGSLFQDFILDQKDRFISVCKKQTIFGKDIDAKGFISHEWKNKTIHLIITENH